MPPFLVDLEELSKCLLFCGFTRNGVVVDCGDQLFGVDARERRVDPEFVASQDKVLHFDFLGRRVHSGSVQISQVQVGSVRSLETIDCEHFVFEVVDNLPEVIQRDVAYF